MKGGGVALFLGRRPATGGSSGPIRETERAPRYDYRGVARIKRDNAGPGPARTEKGRLRRKYKEGEGKGARKGANPGA